MDWLLPLQQQQIFISSTMYPSQFKFDKKIMFVTIQILIEWLLKKIAHDMTAMLSWHVQKCIAIWWQNLNHSKMKFPLNLNCNAKIVSEMGPRTSCLLQFVHVSQQCPVVFDKDFIMDAAMVTHYNVKHNSNVWKKKKKRRKIQTSLRQTARQEFGALNAYKSMA